MQFPEDEQGFAMEDQVYFGDTGLLVHPVVKKDATSVDIYLAEAEVSPQVIRANSALL
jgi:mannosyl-oligosaccharide alpha-1,3-glucosidase